MELISDFRIAVSVGPASKFLLNVTCLLKLAVFARLYANIILKHRMYGVQNPFLALSANLCILNVKHHLVYV